MSITAYVALGSNIGERRQFLEQALELLRGQAGVRVLRVSSFRETEPVGGPALQGRYLNAVAEVETDLDACELLRLLLAIERQCGRVRAERFGPRTLDLDLLLYGQEVLAVHEADCDLIVPHPRLHERLFVLEPLVEIAPLAVHPTLRSTASDLLLRRQSGSDLSGLRALVTGSSSGIGRAIAEALAGAGANVIVHGYRCAARAEEVAEICGKLRGTEARVLLADLRDESACADLVERAWQSGPVDIWVNNAGADILTGAGRHESFEGKLAELWQVDVRATMLLARAAGRRMTERGGSIINMSWDQAETGMAGESGELFAATKGAVLAFSRSLALSLAPHVRVNCLAPGWIQTAWGEKAPAAWQERVLRETPLQRWGTPRDVADAALWLASPAAAFITGQMVRVNGGAVRS
jgi:3-oxoacyl-[acyl-carrier protein] reductase